MLKAQSPIQQYKQQTAAKMADAKIETLDGLFNDYSTVCTDSHILLI